MPQKLPTESQSRFFKPQRKPKFCKSLFGVCLMQIVIQPEELITGLTDQGEPVDVVYLDFSEAFDSVCHHLLVKTMVAMGIHLKMTRWVEEFLKNRIDIERPLLERSYRKQCLPLNASKSHHLSTGGHPDHRLVLSEEANGELMTKCKQINDLGITVNSAFTPSANVLTAARKARGMLYCIKRSFTCLTKEIIVPLYRTLVRPHLGYAIQANFPYLKKDTYHLERIQRAATMWVKGLRDRETQRT